MSSGANPYMNYPYQPLMRPGHDQGHSQGLSHSGRNSPAVPFTGAQASSSGGLGASSSFGSAASRALAALPDEDNMEPATEADENEVYVEWTKLDISNMKIVVLSPQIVVYSQITELYLQNNNLSRLPMPFFRDPGLPNLRALDLSGNQIHWLQPEISNLLSLRYLNLSWNHIRELPNEIGKLFRLDELLLEGNPLMKPSPDVLERGTRAIIAYYRDRMPSADPPPPREWVTNKNHPPSRNRNEFFRVLCYNVLAESYALSDRINYCPSWALAWEYRKHRILKEIAGYEADIICLQEVEADVFTHYFEPELSRMGFQGAFHPKSRARTMGSDSARSVDGCATFWNREVFSLVRQEVVEYQTLGLRKHDILGQTGMNRLITKDNIALAVLLRPTLSSGLRVNPLAESDQLAVVNTHIHWDPAFCDVKLMQVGLMLEQLEGIVAQNSPGGDTLGPGALPVIIAGDFNSVVDSAVYDLLSTRRIPSGHRDFNGFDYGRYSSQGMRHGIDLASAYGTVVGREPPFTNYTGDFVGTLDYIWGSTSLVPTRVLLTLPEEIVVSHNGALPNPFMCSDHLPLVADFSSRHAAPGR